MSDVWTIEPHYEELRGDRLVFGKSAGKTRRVREYDVLRNGRIIYSAQREKDALAYVHARGGTIERG